MRPAVAPHTPRSARRVTPTTTHHPNCETRESRLCFPIGSAVAFFCGAWLPSAGPGCLLRGLAAETPETALLPGEAEVVFPCAARAGTDPDEHVHPGLTQTGATAAVPDAQRRQLQRVRQDGFDSPGSPGHVHGRCGPGPGGAPRAGSDHGKRGRCLCYGRGGDRGREAKIAQ
jgi:hypothetical protein